MTEKILKDEMLSDAELEKVAGGGIGQTAGDSRFLYDYGLMDAWRSDITMMFGWKKYSAEVDAGWSKAGITCVSKPLGSNQYFLKESGKEISHSEACDIVKAKFKKIRD